MNEVRLVSQRTSTVVPAADYAQIVQAVNHRYVAIIAPDGTMAEFVYSGGQGGDIRIKYNLYLNGNTNSADWTGVSSIGVASPCPADGTWAIITSAGDSANVTGFSLNIRGRSFSTGLSPITPGRNHCIWNWHNGSYSGNTYGFNVLKGGAVQDQITHASTDTSNIYIGSSDPRLSLLETRFFVIGTGGLPDPGPLPPVPPVPPATIPSNVPEVSTEPTVFVRSHNINDFIRMNVDGSNLALGSTVTLVAPNGDHMSFIMDRDGRAAAAAQAGSTGEGVISATYNDFYLDGDWFRGGRKDWSWLSGNINSRTPVDGTWTFTFEGTAEHYFPYHFYLVIGGRSLTLRVEFLKPGNNVGIWNWHKGSYSNTADQLGTTSAPNELRIGTGGSPQIDLLYARYFASPTLLTQRSFLEEARGTYEIADAITYGGVPADVDVDYIEFSTGANLYTGTTITYVAPNGDYISVIRTSTSTTTPIYPDQRFLLDGTFVAQRNPQEWSVIQSTITDDTPVDGTWLIAVEGLYASRTGTTAAYTSLPITLSVRGRSCKFGYSFVFPYTGVKVWNWHDGTVDYGAEAPVVGGHTQPSPTTWQFELFPEIVENTLNNTPDPSGVVGTPTVYADASLDYIEHPGGGLISVGSSYVLTAPNGDTLTATRTDTFSTDTTRVYIDGTTTDPNWTATSTITDATPVDGTWILSFGSYALTENKPIVLSIRGRAFTGRVDYVKTAHLVVWWNWHEGSYTDSTPANVTKAYISNGAPNQTDIGKARFFTPSPDGALTVVNDNIAYAQYIVDNNVATLLLTLDPYKVPVDRLTQNVISHPPTVYVVPTLDSFSLSAAVITSAGSTVAVVAPNGDMMILMRVWQNAHVPLSTPPTNIITDSAPSAQKFLLDGTFVHEGVDQCWYPIYNTLGTSTSVDGTWYILVNSAGIYNSDYMNVNASFNRNMVLSVRGKSASFRYSYLHPTRKINMWHWHNGSYADTSTNTGVPTTIDWAADDAPATIHYSYTRLHTPRIPDAEDVYEDPLALGQLYVNHVTNIANGTITTVSDTVAEQQAAAVAAANGAVATATQEINAVIALATTTVENAPATIDQAVADAYDTVVGSATVQTILAIANQKLAETQQTVDTTIVNATNVVNAAIADATTIVNGVIDTAFEVYGILPTPSEVIAIATGVVDTALTTAEDTLALLLTVPGTATALAEATKATAEAEIEARQAYLNAVIAEKQAETQAEIDAAIITVNNTRAALEAELAAREAFVMQTAAETQATVDSTVASLILLALATKADAEAEAAAREAQFYALKYQTEQDVAQKQAETQEELDAQIAAATVTANETIATATQTALDTVALIEATADAAYLLVLAKKAELDAEVERLDGEITQTTVETLATLDQAVADATATVIFYRDLALAEVAAAEAQALALKAQAEQQVADTQTTVTDTANQALADATAIANEQIANATALILSLPATLQGIIDSTVLMAEEEIANQETFINAQVEAALITLGEERAKAEQRVEDEQAALEAAVDQTVIDATILFNDTVSAITTLAEETRDTVQAFLNDNYSGHLLAVGGSLFTATPASNLTHRAAATFFSTDLFTATPEQEPVTAWAYAVFPCVSTFTAMPNAGKLTHRAAVNYIEGSLFTGMPNIGALTHRAEVTFNGASVFASIPNPGSLTRLAHGAFIGLSTFNAMPNAGALTHRAEISLTGTGVFASIPNPGSLIPVGRAVFAGLGTFNAIPNAGALIHSGSAVFAGLTHFGVMPNAGALAHTAQVSFTGLSVQTATGKFPSPADLIPVFWSVQGGSTLSGFATATRTAKQSVTAISTVVAKGSNYNLGKLSLTTGSTIQPLATNEVYAKQTLAANGTASLNGRAIRRAEWGVTSELYVSIDAGGVRGGRLVLEGSSSQACVAGIENQAKLSLTTTVTQVTRGRRLKTASMSVAAGSSWSAVPLCLLNGEVSVVTGSLFTPHATNLAYAKQTLVGVGYLSARASPLSLAKLSISGSSSFNPTAQSESQADYWVFATSTFTAAPKLIRNARQSLATSSTLQIYFGVPRYGQWSDVTSSSFSGTGKIFQLGKWDKTSVTSFTAFGRGVWTNTLSLTTGSTSTQTATNLVPARLSVTGTASIGATAQSLSLAKYWVSTTTSFNARPAVLLKPSVADFPTASSNFSLYARRIRPSSLALSGSSQFSISNIYLRRRAWSAHTGITQQTAKATKLTRGVISLTTSSSVVAKFSIFLAGFTSFYGTAEATWKGIRLDSNALVAEGGIHRAMIINPTVEVNDQSIVAVGGIHRAMSVAPDVVIKDKDTLDVVLDDFPRQIDAPFDV